MILWKKTLGLWGGRVHQANHISCPYSIQSSAQTVLQPGITHAKVHLRSGSTEALLTRDMASATLSGLLNLTTSNKAVKASLEALRVHPVERTLPKQKSFYLKSIMSRYFSFCYSHFLTWTLLGHDMRLCSLCYINNDRTAFSRQKMQGLRQRWRYLRPKLQHPVCRLGLCQRLID